MEDEPSTTFNNLATLFKKLGISVEGTDQGEEEEEEVEEEKAEEKEVDTEKPSMGDSLSYEERAARRKAEREKRMMERETGIVRNSGL